MLFKATGIGSLLLVATLLCPVNAAAETVVVFSTKYDPLIVADKGDISSCGVLFTVSSGAKNLGVQGSLNFTVNGQPRPSIYFAMKAVAGHIKGNAFAYQRVEYAWIKVGEVTTSGKMKSIPGENPKSWFGVSFDDPNFTTLPLRLLKSGGWLGVRLEGQKSDTVFALPPDDKDSPVEGQVSVCYQALETKLDALTK